MRNPICILLITTILCILTIPYTVDAADDLIFHFPFDEGNGDKTKDKSDNSFEGTIKNANWVEGVVGEALEFNSGFVNVEPLGVDVPDEMTIEMWFKPAEKIAGGGRIDLLYRLTGGGRPHLTFNRGGLLFGCYVATNAVEFEVISTYTAFEPQWYYLVLTQDQDTAIMYIDGKKDAEANAGGPVRMDFSANGMCIAANQGNSNFFNGTIDEVKMRDVALSADDVKKNMDQVLAVDADDKLTTTWGDIKSRL